MHHLECCPKEWVGCGLMWENKVVTYAARQLKLYERNYPTHDLELVALILHRKHEVITYVWSTS